MTTASTTLRSPFPGLRPFDEEDADFFFGQEEQQEGLLGRLSVSRFVSVIGASGCGKSSLVRAGLIPLLRQQQDAGGNRWAIAVTHPGTQPLSQLASSLHSLALNRGQSLEEVAALMGRHTLGILDFLKASGFAANRRLLIFVDQFEEVFRFRRDRRDEKALNESALYVKILLGAAFEPRSPVYIVTTMRSEYLEDCSEFYDLSEAMNSGLFLLPRMTRLQCEEAIVSPVECQEIGIEPSLTQTLLNETEERIDGLPLLQHALRVIWDRWKMDNNPSRNLGLEHFEIKEGDKTAPMVNRLLDVHLDRIYSELKEDQRVAKTCFKLLSEWDARGKETRRTCPTQEVMDVSGASLAAVQRVVHAFRDESKGRTFLRAMDESRRGLEERPIGPADVLDLSHECLMRQWGRLRGWMKEEYENSTVLTDLARDTQAGAELSEFATRKFMMWRDEFDPGAEWARRYDRQVHPITGKPGVPLELALSFLANNERREVWARRVRWSSIAGAVLLAGLIGAYFVRSSASQREATINAQAAALDAQKARLQTQETQFKLEAANLETTKSNLAAAAARKDAQDQEILAELRGQQAAVEERERKEAVESSRAAELAEKKANDQAAELAKNVRELNNANATLTAAKAQLQQLTTQLTGATKDLTASNNQKSALSLIDSARRRVDAGQTNEALALLTQSLELDNKSPSASMWIFDLLLHGTPHPLLPPYLHNPIGRDPKSPFLRAAFDPNDRIMTGSLSGSAQIWDLSGAKIGDPLARPEALNFIEFSVDGNYLVTASADFTVTVWNAKNLAQLKQEKFLKPALSASFSPTNSQNIVAASWDGTAMIWNWPTGKKILLKPQAPLNFAAFSPDGKLIVTACFDGNARIWDAETGKAHEKSPGVPLTPLHRDSQVRSARFNPIKGTTQIVAAFADGTAVIWDWAEGFAVGETLRHGRTINSAEFSPDAQLIVTASDDTTARVWDAKTGMPLGEPLPHGGHVMSAVFSKDGKRVLTAALDGLARIWDVKIDFDNPELLAALASAQSGLDKISLQKIPEAERKELLKAVKDRAALDASTKTGAFVQWFLANR